MHSEENIVSNTTAAPEISPSPASWWRFLVWFWHRTHRLASFVVLLGVFFILLLFLPTVQTWLARTTADFLSKELKVKIDVKSVNIGLFGDIDLKNVFIADKSGDTLLFVKQLSAEINLPLALVTGSIHVNKISLDGGNIQLKRHGGQYAYNYDFLLNLLKTPDDGAPAKPLQLNIKYIHLQETKFVDNDDLHGSAVTIYIQAANIHLGEVNTKKNLVLIEDINIQSPTVSIRKWVGKKPILDTIFQKTPSDTTQKPLKVIVKCVQIKKGNFLIDNFRPTTARPRPAGVIDFRHLNTSNININLNTLVIEDEVYTGNIQQLSLEEKNGFVLSDLYVKSALISNTAMQFNGLHLQTPHTSLRDTFQMRYKGGWDDFEDFNNAVKLQFNIKESAYIGVTDLIKFDLNLYENPFFRQNQIATAYLSGDINGKVNNLSGNNIQLRIRETFWKGRFSLNDIDDPNNAVVQIKFDNLKTNMNALKLLIPNFNVPDNFYTLGKLNFKGSCTGAFDDFVIDGDLNTDLGRVNTDMRLDLLSDKKTAKYSGKITLDSFNLRKWTGNNAYNFISATAKVEDGKGLTLKNASAKMTADIKSITFKNYTYQNIAFNGVLSPKLFNGTLNIKDENIDIALAGKMDIDTVMQIKIKATIGKLDLKKLHLDTVNQYVLKGAVDIDLENVNLQHPDWDKIRGKAKINHLEAFLPKKKQTIRMDSLLVQTKLLPNGERFLAIDSDVATAKLQGNFLINQLDEALRQYFFANFIEFALQIGLRPKADVDIGRKTAFNFEVAVHDNHNILQLLVPTLDTIRSLKMSGYFNSKNDEIQLKADAPHLKIGDIAFKNLNLAVNGAQNEAKTVLSIGSTVLPNQQILAPFNINTNLSRDTIKVGVHATDFNKIVNNLNVQSEIFLYQDSVAKAVLAQIRFKSSDIKILNYKWDIGEDNYLRIGKDYFAANDFVFSKDEKRIEVSDIDTKGLSLKLRNFDFIDLNEFINYDDMKFDGKFNADVTVKDIFQQKEFSAQVTSDTLLVNCDKWGKMTLRADMKNLQQPITSTLTVQNGVGNLITSGKFYPAFIHNTEKPANFFDFQTNIDQYPFKIAEYFIGEGIENTHGQFKADVRVFGIPEKPHIAGSLFSEDGGTTIEYLNTHYKFPKQRIYFNDSLIDATNVYIFDKYNHKARLNGGITHRNFSNWGINADIYADNFLVLDTDKILNPDYYGHAIGKGEIHFGGTFKQTDIIVKKFEPLDSSILNIPVRTRQTDSEVSFIKFKPKNLPKSTDLPKETQKSTEIKGIYFEMTTIVNDKSQVNLIFDEKAGDVIKGHGYGTMNVKVYRSGELELKGNYEITKGDYLFTLYNVVNKNFKVNKGRIEWTGDPLNANIDLVTEYQQGLSAAPYSFISEYIQRGDPSEGEARKPTPVKLQMMLKGQLLQPEISFALGFPNLTGQIKNITDTKLALIAQEPNELNRQVFGLVMMGSFLPADVFLQQGLETGTAAISNTFTQLLSNQLSIYISQLLSDVLTKKGYVSGVDFNFNYLRHDASNADLRSFSTGNEIQVRFKNQLFNDRLSVQVGGNFINNTTESGDQTGYYFLGDVILEYSISQDQRFKVRAYRTPEQSLEGNRYRTGLGVTYRQEFDSFQEFLNGLRKTAGKAVEN
jgi:TamB, inner membrane protein subunit of TAM complex